MNGQIWSTVVTAALGAVGIASTYMLAYGQQRADKRRASQARKDRYVFAEHEKRSELYADLMAELRFVHISVRLRTTVTASYEKHFRTHFVTVLREAAAMNAEEAEKAEGFAEFATAIENDDELASSWATREVEESIPEFPPPIEIMPTVKRVSQLAARIAVVAGIEVADAASAAERETVSLVLRSAARELHRTKPDLDLQPFESAMSAFEVATIYELRLQPYGEKSSLKDLLDRAAAEQQDVEE